MDVIIYCFVHVFNITHMTNQFNVSASTIRKYVDIVYDILIDKNKLFNKYINILSCQYLRDIVTYLKNLINILNICETINCHNLLMNILSNKIIFVVGQFFNKKNAYRRDN